MRRFYRPNATGGWSSALSFAETLKKTPDGFDVPSADGTKFRFVQYKNTNGYNRYRMETLTDPHGLQTRLAYN